MKKQSKAKSLVSTSNEALKIAENVTLNISSLGDMDAQKNGEQSPSLSGNSHSKAKHQVISSLFSFNPQIEVPDHLKFYEKKDYSPSNGISCANLFEDTPLDKRIVNHLRDKMNMKSPTSIQDKAIRCVLEEKSNSDIIIQAETGSGKTLAYLLPIVHAMLSDEFAGNAHREVGTVSLVICPTRELANQVNNVLNKLLSLNYSPRWIVHSCISGGEKKKSEKARLRKGINILVVTPGRLLDHLRSTKAFRLSNIEWVIMDEADRFVELGFQNTMKEIFKEIDSQVGRRKYKIILCSATVNDQVQELGGSKLKEPIFISATSADADQVSNSMKCMPNQIRQEYIIAPAKLRLVTLVAEIANVYGLFEPNWRKPKSVKKIIVYFSNCDSVDFIYELFSRCQKIEGHGKKASSVDEPISMDNGEESPKGTNIDERHLSQIFGPDGQNIKVFKLHGKIAHQERMKSYREFSSNQTENTNHCILFCTDVAARGLDMPSVTNILQYDPPTDLKDYVHRIGRTGRLGEGGTGVLWLLPSEIDYLDRLKSFGLDGFHEKKVDAVLRKLTNKNEIYKDAASRFQMIFEQWLVSNLEHQELAKKAFSSFIKSYSTHVLEEKKIFHVRKLHLGHLAKSFGLRHSPSEIKQTVMKKAKAVKRAESYTKMNLPMLDEFEAAPTKLRKVQ